MILLISLSTRFLPPLLFVCFLLLPPPPLSLPFILIYLLTYWVAHSRQETLYVKKFRAFNVALTLQLT